MVPGKLDFVAGGRVVVAGGAITSQTSTGGTVVARTGAGVFTVTLSDGGVDATECVMYVQPESAAFANYVYAHTSDTVKGVSCFDAAAMALDNVSFCYAIYRRTGF